MTSEYTDISNAFAETACKLLSEYTQRLLELKKEMVRIIEQYHTARGTKIDPAYLQRRFHDEMMSFHESNSVYEKLIRQSSQWVEHGKTPNPNLQLELSVRLADFESVVRNMHQFFGTQML